MNFNAAPTVSAFGFSGPDFLGYEIMKDDTKEQWRRETAWTERMANTQWQRGVADMKAAGLNPMLAYHQGPNAAPTSPSKHFNAPPSAGANATLQTGAQTDLLHAEADLKRAQAEDVREGIPTHAVTRESLGQQITESMARIQDIRASVSERTANAARAYQQIENLRAELPRLKADTNRLLAQARNYAAETTLKTAEERQLQQVIKANLPEIERLQKELLVELQRIMRPGQELDADARQSFIGILGAYLKALIPAGTIVGALPLGRFGGNNKGPTTSGTIHKSTGRNAPDIHRR